MKTETTLVRPVAGAIDVDFDSLSPRERELAGKLGSTHLAKVALAMGKSIPQPVGNPQPPAMSEAERAKRLAELTLQTGSVLRAKTIMGMKIPG